MAATEIIPITFERKTYNHIKDEDGQIWITVPQFVDITKIAKQTVHDNVNRMNKEDKKPVKLPKCRETTAIKLSECREFVRMMKTGPKKELWLQKWDMYMNNYLGNYEVSFRKNYDDLAFADLDRYPDSFFANVCFDPDLGWRTMMQHIFFNANIPEQRSIYAKSDGTLVGYTGNKWKDLNRKEILEMVGKFWHGCCDYAFSKRTILAPALGLKFREYLDEGGEWIGQLRAVVPTIAQMICRDSSPIDDFEGESEYDPEDYYDRILYFCSTESERNKPRYIKWKEYNLL